MENRYANRVTDNRNGGIAVNPNKKMATVDSTEANRRAKISNTMKGVPKSEETKVRMRAAAKKRCERINAALAAMK